jgi:2-hydroxychromene-2-carboxylate isomerase
VRFSLSMGDVIRLADRRQRRAGRAQEGASGRPVVHFDLSCPFSYLALERVDRLLEKVRWRPTCADALHRGDPWSEPGAGLARAAAERRAQELRVPLVWPANHPAPAQGAMRAAHYASELGRGGEFSLAAARLAFCGGFDLEDPEVLAEAAAAGGVSLDGCLQAARDPARDGPIERTALQLLARGADRLPVVRVGRVLYRGERGVAQAAAVCRPPARRGAGVG